MRLPSPHPDDALFKDVKDFLAAKSVGVDKAELFYHLMKKQTEPPVEVMEVDTEVDIMQEAETLVGH